MQFLTIPAFELITGCMFSGKTEELIKRLRRAKYAKCKVELFKSHVDDRCADDCTETHNGNQFKAITVRDPWEIVTIVEELDIDVIGIDEIQFFDEEIVKVIHHLVFNLHKNVIAAGLNRDFRGKPFGHMPLVLSMAHSIDTLHAFCTICGATAVHSQRIVASSSLVKTGAKESYEARCTLHFDPQIED